MLPELKVLNAAGSVLAQGNGVLCYEPAYQPGDVLELTVPQPGYYVICLDDAMGEELVFFRNTVFRLEVPFEEAHISYSPRAFAGEMHYLTVRPATADEISAPRNLARNRYDHHDNTGIFPHAWANVDEAFLQAPTAAWGNLWDCRAALRKLVSSVYLESDLNLPFGKNGKFLFQLGYTPVVSDMKKVVQKTAALSFPKWALAVWDMDTATLYIVKYDRSH